MNIHKNPETGLEVYEYLTPAGVATIPGDGVYAGANWNAIGDYTAGGLGDTYFEKGPAGLDVWRVGRMIVSLEVAAASVVGAGYGTGGVIPFGILVQVRDGGGRVIRDLTGTVPVRAHRMWQMHAYDASLGAATAFGNRDWHLRWTFAKRGGTVHLRGDRGDRLSVLLRDDFSAICSMHAFMIQGVNETVIR